MTPHKVVVFTCNWKGYSGLESAGAEHLAYSPVVLPLRVACIGQISPGIILKALERGAEGVLLLGCPPGECQYEFGNRHAQDVFAEAKDLAGLLGYRDEQLKLEWVNAGDGEAFVKIIQGFIDGLNEGLVS